MFFSDVAFRRDVEITKIDKRLMASTVTGDVKSALQQMAPVPQFPFAPGRKIGAWVCLVAALLLWSPVWAVAWQAKGMNCCANGMCPAHTHQNMNRRPSESTTSPQTSTKCTHDSGNGLMFCSMTCCHTEAHVFLASITFVLPPTLLLSQSPLLATPFVVNSEQPIFPAITPPDHPPRVLPS
jgi:hypothetical protein